MEQRVRPRLHALRLLSGSLIIMCVGTGGARAQDCGTATQCYVKAAAMLNQATQKINDLQSQIVALQKAIALASAGDDIVMSRDDLPSFQIKHKDDGTTWKLCDGGPGTVDLTGRYPRGAGPNLPPLGGHLEDAVGPHEHPIIVPGSPSMANWSWSAYQPIVRGGDRTVIGAPDNGGVGSPSIRAGNPDKGSADETRPKTTIINFFCRVR
jgi:hypothetical protein